MLVKCRLLGPAKESDLVGLVGTQGPAVSAVTQTVVRPHWRGPRLELVVCHKAREKNETRE